MIACARKTRRAAKLPKPYYRGGGQTIYCGDCRKILPLFEPASVDLLLTDPPYAIRNRFGRTKTKTMLDGRPGYRILQFVWDHPDAADSVVAILRLAFSLTTPKASCFVFVGFDTAERYASPAWEAGFVVKPAAWIKKCPPPAGYGTRWPSSFELAYYGYRRGAWFGDRDAKRRNAWVADSYRHGVPGKCGHRAQKPLSLIAMLLRSLAPDGGLVLDCFLGSGTTLVACKQLGRRGIGIERERKYCRMAAERIEAAARNSNNGSE